jgi:chromosome segregation ATPase
LPFTELQTVLDKLLFYSISHWIRYTRRELQELRGEIQRLQEDAGRRQTQAQQDHRNVQALEQSAKELEDGLEAVSSRSKAKDAVIASLEERLSALTDEKKQLAKAKDQALLDAKRALSSISSSGKGAKNAFQQKEMAEADRDKAHKEMKEAQETAARAEAAAAEAIQDRDRVLALKASIDAQAAMNDRIRADLHTAHEVQTKAEADRYAAQEAAAAAAAECAAAEAARDAALEAQKSVEETLKAAHEDLEAKHIALIEALNRAEAAEKTREKEVSIWKQRTAETEKNLVAEEDKMLATQKQFTSMMAKFAEVDAGYDATLDQVKILEKELKLRENVAGNLRIQLENEVKNTEEAKNQLEEALKEQKRLEMELVAAEEAAVQSAEEEILSVRRELEASLADSDGEIKNLKAQLDAATVNAAKSVDESAERLQEVEEELENVKMALVTAMQEQDRLQSAVVAAETELKAIHAELEESKKAQISGVSNARDELHKEIQLEISRRDVAEKNLESLKMELEAANNARDSAKAEVEDLIKAQNAAAEVQANTSATMDTKSSLLLDELAVLKKKNEEHEVELAALLDAKASAEIKLEDFKKSNQKELDNLRELNRRLLSREKSGRQGTNTSAAAAAAAAAAGVEEGLQSPAVKKASTDMAEKMDTLKKSTDKLFSAHRSSPGGGIKTAGPAATPTRSPLSRSSLDTKTP